MSQEGKYALITGATSGIGKAMTYLLAKEGYNLILVARNENQLIELQRMLCEAYNKKIQVFSVDLTDSTEIDGLVQALDGQALKIDLCVNNAGIGFYGLFENVEIDRDLAVIDTNIRGFTYFTKVIKPYLKQGASLLQVASTAAFAPGPYMATYYASKSYVLSLSMALRSEWQAEGIHVSILCPGPTKTAFIEKAQMQKTGLAKLTAMTPEAVAKVAYKEVRANRAIIIPGITNKIACLVMSILPIRLSTLLVRSTQKK